MRKLLLLLSFAVGTLASAQSHKNLADTLRVMAVSDQKAAGLPPEVDGKYQFTPAWIQFKDSVFASHYSRLQVIFANYGYPGYDKVGAQGSNNFWLLVQHLDKWPEFQESVLKAMAVEVERKNANGVDFAMLTDRVRLNTGRQQVYGTQLTYNTDSCQAIPKPLENAATVNIRRKAVGLNTIEEYLNEMSESHFAMNHEVYEKKGIKGPKLYIVP